MFKWLTASNMTILVPFFIFLLDSFYSMVVYVYMLYLPACYEHKYQKNPPSVQQSTPRHLSYLESNSWTSHPSPDNYFSKSPPSHIKANTDFLMVRETHQFLFNTSQFLARRAKDWSHIGLKQFCKNIRFQNRPPARWYFSSGIDQ